MHTHITHELYLLYDGEARISTEQGNYPLKKGQAALIAPNTYHTIANMSKTFQLRAVNLQLYKLSAPTDPEETRLHALLDAARQPGVLLLGTQPELLRLIQLLAQAKHADAPANTYLLRAYATELLVHLLRAIPTSPVTARETLPTATLVTSATQLERMHIIEEYMMFHCADADIVELAQQLAVSEQHLRRFIKANYAMTFTQLLSRQRIQICKHLLQTTASPIGEIWQQVGFQSSQHFSAAFKRYTGMTASQYRSRFR